MYDPDEDVESFEVWCPDWAEGPILEKFHRYSEYVLRGGGSDQSVPPAPQSKLDPVVRFEDDGLPMLPSKHQGGDIKLRSLRQKYLHRFMTEHYSESTILIVRYECCSQLHSSGSGVLGGRYYPGAVDVRCITPGRIL